MKVVKDSELDLCIEVQREENVGNKEQSMGIRSVSNRENDNGRKLDQMKVDNTEQGTAGG